MRNSVRFPIILSLAGISLARLASPAQAADLKDPSLYTGGLLDNTLSLTASGDMITFIDPNNSGCDYTGTFADNSFAPTTDCDGDEFFNIDINPPDSTPASSSLGRTISTDFSPLADGLPPIFNYGAEILEDTSGEFIYGTSATAKGVAEDFFSTSAGQPSLTASARDLNLGAFTNPSTTDDVAIIPRTLFVELDPSSSTFPLPNGDPGAFYDRLYVSSISQANISQPSGLLLFTNVLLGHASQIPVGGGDEEFIYNWQGISTTQFADSADSVFERLIRDKVAVSATTSLSVSFFPKTPEPSSVFGLLSVLGAGVFLKKKKQD